MTSLPSPEQLYESAACGLLLTDSEGLIQRVNSTFCQWLGYRPEDLLGRLRIEDLLTKSSLFFHRTHWAPLLQLQGSVAEMQLDLLHKDGLAVSTLMNAIRRDFGGQQFDELAVFIATDRKRYEQELLSTRRAAETSLMRLRGVQQELLESRDVLGVAMRAAKMGVWSRDLSTDRVWVSAELEKLFGVEEGSFNGTRESFYRMVHEDDRAPLMAALDAALKSASDYVVEFRMRKPDGQLRIMEARGRAIYSLENRPLTIFGIVTDMTDRRDSEARLRQLNDQLSLTDRRKDEFLATLAHELRNPLAPIHNVLQVLKLRKGDDAQLQWAQEIITRQLNQMTHLVDDLLEVTRITQGRLALRRQPIILGDVINQAVESCRTLVDQASHHISIDIPEPVIVLDADVTRLLQVVCNLINNAVKYTPRGGQIWVSVRLDGREVIISVRDSGIGIAEEHLNSIFTMFSQLTPALERSHGGLGIGLALARGLVELHGGSLRAYSQGEGQGSEFVIRLPLPGAQMAPVAKVDAGLSAARKRKRILIVDDNSDAAQSMATALDLLGYETRIANTGPGGLALAQEFLPNVVLLDIGLPGMNGYEVARRLRQSDWAKDMLLVAATGWALEKDKAEAKAAGFNHHLTKPIDFNALDKLLNS